MSLYRQGTGLAATHAAAAVRAFTGQATYSAGPASLTALRAAPPHSSRGMSTAAAYMWAPAPSPPSSVTAALSAATGLVSEWTQRISIWLAAPKSKATQQACYASKGPSPCLSSGCTTHAFCLGLTCLDSKQNPMASASSLAYEQAHQRPRKSRGGEPCSRPCEYAREEAVFCAQLITLTCPWRYCLAWLQCYLDAYLV